MPGIAGVIRTENEYPISARRYPELGTPTKINLQSAGVVTPNVTPSLTLQFPPKYWSGQQDLNLSQPIVFTTGDSYHPGRDPAKAGQ